MYAHQLGHVLSEEGEIAVDAVVGAEAERSQVCQGSQTSDVAAEAPGAARAAKAHEHHPPAGAIARDVRPANVCGGPAAGVARLRAHPNHSSRHAASTGAVSGAVGAAVQVACSVGGRGSARASRCNHKQSLRTIPESKLSW